MRPFRCWFHRHKGGWRPSLADAGLYTGSVGVYTTDELVLKTSEQVTALARDAQVFIDKQAMWEGDAQ